MPKTSNPDYPLGELDGLKWAEEFVRRFGGDVELLHGWFANAIMTGYDKGCEVGEAQRAGDDPNDGGGDAQHA